MRILILFLLSCGLCLGQQPMPFTKNPFSTNQNHLPVMGTNSISISNTIPGGSLWTFYGATANTVARLGDIPSSGNFVMKYNGPSDGQIATNLTLQGSDLFVPSLFTIQDDNTSTVMSWDGTTLNLGRDYSKLFIPIPQTNSGTLDVAGAITAYGGISVENGATIHGGANINGSVTFGDDVLFDTSINAASIAANSGQISHLLATDLTSTFITNTSLAKIETVKADNVTVNFVTGSRLAEFNSSNQLTNSAYSDADIAALQAATNSLQTQLTAATNALVTASNALNLAIANTNAFIRNQNGLGSNTFLISPTNQPSLSNQTALTVNGLVGQTGALISGTSNGTAQVFCVDRSGNVIISNSLPSLILSNNAHKFSLDTSDGFTLNFKQDGSSQATLNNSGGFNASTITFAGGQAIYKAGTGTNGFSSGATALPSGAILASNLTLLGAVKLGPSGGVITNILSASATLDFPSTTVGAVSDLPITVTGAADGDAVQVGAPQGSCTGIIGSYSGFASNNTVFVRFTSTGTAQDPASGTFKVIVTKF